MRINQAQFCTLATSPKFLEWLKQFTPGFYEGLVHHLRQSKGCGANTQKMLKILTKIMRKPEGPEQLKGFLKKHYPQILIK